MILAERHARVMAEANAAVAEAEAANAQADLSSSEALIAHLKLAIEKLRRELYGTRSEHKARLLDQMELRLEDLEAAATEDAIILSLTSAHSFQLEEVARYLHPGTARPVLVQALLAAPMFMTRWRWNASIALALLRFAEEQRSA